MWEYRLENTPEGQTAFVAWNICEACKIAFKSNSPATTKYCDKCKREIKRDKTRARVQRYRSRKAENTQA